MLNLNFWVWRSWWDRSDEGGSGSSNYKIKYFGFDDLSESEDDEDDDCQVERKDKQKKN